ncbi:uncharacterized protein LOC111075641 [Drosophila obscura]|uniref:uncharacterized protein LOC111075641 n=1 Tax=Drosophila obscura TaxID=7282 RepID=UPI001BB1240C|nr:uncharacterized protein LOC111075641 [Drosophila obscura]
MERCDTKCSGSASKTTSTCGSAKQSKCSLSKLKNLCCKPKPAEEVGGRNPFLRYLAHFKKCNKEKLCNLQTTQIVIAASKEWNRMTCEEKSPYVQAARNAKYMFWSRSKDTNRVLGKLREMVGCAKPQMQEPFKLIGDLDSWRQNVLDDVFDVGEDGD